MNMINTFWFFLWIALTVAFVSIGNDLDGTSGAILGGIVGVFGLPVLMICTVIYFDRPTRNPERPTCSAGCCNAQDYKCSRIHHNHFVWVCRCGKEFLEDSDWFMEVSASNVLTPYMKWEKKTGWTREQV